MIEIKNVTYSYRVTDTVGTPMLKVGVLGLNLTIKDGEFIVLTGSSGCGKTTVCRLINGLIPHYFDGEKSGEVLLNGKDVSAQPIYETAQTVGSVFQNPRSQFFNVDTTSELAFFAENQGRNVQCIKDSMEEMSDKMNMSKLLGRSMFKLSGGEKQKIACGTIAVADSSVVVLDEPSSNLDKDAIEDLRKTLEMWKIQGKTVIIAEHRLYFLRELADRVIVFENGAIKNEIVGEEFRKLSEEDTKKMGLRSVINVSEYPKVKEEDTENTIQLKDFKFTYPDKIHGIAIKSLTLPRNKIIAIVGHNGAGKSTFARTFCGLNKKAKGTVCFDGKSVPTSKMLDYCYMIMQDVNHQLFTESVEEEVLLSVPENLPDEERERIALDALEMLDIDQYAQMHPMALSGGQKQRVAIASGIATDKEFILMDEPTSGLDYVHMKQVAEVMKKLKEKGKTLLVITHDNELISCCADYVLECCWGCKLA
ncbi:MAG: ABC transporter ATP-binding protein [Lachnospiraceae bacterium]|nr:ABC transporter ATP-binding protein [Lachnospiraceae bacterium]